MATHKRITIVATALAIALVAPRSASAMPQFARKFKLPCSGCHDALAYPRLNDVGYKFRRAGFRMPENIGKEELTEFTMTDYFSARVQTDNTTDLDRENGSTDSANTFTGELSFYALTGSFQKYFASETELGIAPGESPEVENAYGRVVYGSEELWLTARAGVFHAIEGFGGSDRPLGAARPLIFDVAANHNQETFMRVTELDRIGVDVGVQWRNTSLSVEVVNRARLELAEDGELEPTAIAADRGGGKDLIVVANQILGTRSGLSAYWAHGKAPLPTDPEAFEMGTDETTWNSDYDKLAVFGSAGTGTLLALGGAQLGFDQARDAGMTTRFRSIGWFAEANLGLAPYLVGYVRADFVDPSTSVGGNQIFAGTLGALLYRDWVSLVPELQLRRMSDATAGSFVVHASVIY